MSDINKVFEYVLDTETTGFYPETGDKLVEIGIIEICDRLARSDYDARAAEPCIGVERADLVVSGCAIVQAMYNTWPIKKLRVADRGVREGLLIGLMKDADQEQKAQVAEPAHEIAEKLM